MVVLLKSRHALLETAHYSPQNQEMELAWHEWFSDGVGSFLRQRKDELEQRMSALQESRRELMVQLEGLMKLLKVRHLRAMFLTHYCGVFKLSAHSWQWLFQLLYVTFSPKMAQTQIWNYFLGLWKTNSKWVIALILSHLLELGC